MIRRTPLPRLACLAALLSLTFSAYGASMKKPDIKLNPHPRMRYEITVTVKGAPGELTSIAGHVDYVVTNPSSVPLTPISGATLPPETELPVAFERVGPDTYKGVVYIDQIQDEDYFGLGMCHWSIVATAPDFIHGKVNFSPAIYRKDILAGNEVVKYFSFKSYENADDSRTDGGSPDKSAFNDPSRTFSITLKASEKTL